MIHSADWDAYQHHRQAYFDRDRIASLNALWAASPDSESGPDGPVDDDTGPASDISPKGPPHA